MQTGLARSRSGYSIKRALAFAALGFQVLTSQMMVSCTEKDQAPIVAPKKDRKQLNQELLQAAEKADWRALVDALNGGADVNARNKDNRTALMGIAGLESWGRTTATTSDGSGMDAARFLLAKGAKVDAKDNRDQTALMVAAGMGNRDIAELLMANGADVNLKDIDRETALTRTAVTGDAELARALMERGADADVKNVKEGRTALSIAVRNGCTATEQFLRKRGAD